MLRGIDDTWDIWWGGRMQTGHTTHLVMSVNGSPLGLWVPHSVLEAQAFDVPYSDTPLSAVSESSFLGRGSSQCCFQRRVFGHHCQGPGPLPRVTLPFWNIVVWLWLCFAWLDWGMRQKLILKCISKGEQELTQWQTRRFIKLKLTQCPLRSRVGVWTAKDDVKITCYTHCIPELGSELLRTMSKSHITPTAELKLRVTRQQGIQAWNKGQVLKYKKTFHMTEQPDVSICHIPPFKS